MRYEAHFPAVRTSVPSARRFVSERIADVPSEISEAAALIASELASNSVRHAASAFEIRVELLPDRIHIEVEDDGGGEPIVQSPAPTDTSGRGLQIVAALADEWGVIPKPESGKTVWVSIALRTSDDTRHARQGHDLEDDQRRRSSGRRSGSSGSETKLLCVGRETGGADVGYRACRETGSMRPRYAVGPLGCRSSEYERDSIF